VSNRRKPKNAKAACRCCATNGLPTYRPTIPGDVLEQVCDPCLTGLVLGGTHPHTMFYEEPNRWPAAGTSGVYPEPSDGESYATTSGVVGDGHNEADMAYTRQTLHDSLLEMLGDRRRSGIWWTHHTGDEANTMVTDVLYTEDVPVEDMDHADSSRVAEVREESLRWLSANADAVLVVAWAIGAVPEGAVL
jgi:hypothetical protein